MSDSFVPTPDTALGPLIEDWKFFLANLPYQATPQDIRDHFQQFGVVNFCKLIYDVKTGKSRGYGFLYMNDAQGDDAVGQYMLSSDHRITFMGKPRVFLTRNDKEKSAAAAAAAAASQQQYGSRRRHDDSDRGGSYRPPGGGEVPPSSHRGSRDRYHDRRGSSYDEHSGRRDVVVETRLQDAPLYDDRHQPLLQADERSHSRRSYPEDDHRYSNHHLHHSSDSRRYDDSDNRDNGYHPPKYDDGDYNNNPRDGRERSRHHHHHDDNYNNGHSYRREESFGPPPTHNGNGESEHYREHASDSRSNHRHHDTRHDGRREDDDPRRVIHSHSNGVHDGQYDTLTNRSHDDRYLDAPPSARESRPPLQYDDDRDKMGGPDRYYDNNHGPTQRQPLLPPRDGGGGGDPLYYPSDDRIGQRPPSPPPQQFRPRSATPPPHIDLGGRYQPPMEPPPPSTVVILENLPFDVTAREISVMLNEQHGMNVRRCTLEYDGEIGQQYALVTLGSEEEVVRCLDLSYRYLLSFHGQEVLARREANGGVDTLEPTRQRELHLAPTSSSRPISPPPHESARPLAGRWISAEDSERRSSSNNNRYPPRSYLPRGDSGGGSGRPSREQRRDRPY